MHLAVLSFSIVVFTTAVGVIVKKLLDHDAELKAAAQKAGADELLARAARRSDLPRFLVRLMARRRIDAIRRELPDALDMISNSLSAGLTLPQALMRNLDHFPPAVADEFARVIYDTRLGYSVAGAFANFAERIPSGDVRMIAIASEIGVARGGDLAGSYRMLSSLLRDNLAFESELKAMTTEGRMQALVMSVLPFALMLILGVVNPMFVVPMVTTVVGWCVLLGLCVMIGIAYVWIRKIVDIEV